MKRTILLCGMFSLLLMCFVNADIQLSENHSFEQTYYGMPQQWWDYNNTSATGEVSSSTNWVTDGEKSVYLRLDPNADPIWCGVGQGLTIKPVSGTDLRRLYICVNVNVLYLENAHLKLEAKLYKANGDIANYEFAIVKEDKTIVTGRQTLSVFLDARELQDDNGEYYVVIGVVLGSEFVYPSPDAEGAAYVDEVYALATYTRRKNYVAVKPIGSFEIDSTAPFEVIPFKPDKDAIGPYYERYERKADFYNEKR